MKINEKLLLVVALSTMFAVQAAEPAEKRPESRFFRLLIGRQLIG